ncbi:hypothetical protein PHMEG_00028575, partial [Phytophthora megakarya]
RSEKLSADDVFHHLGLSYKGDDFLKSPALSTWISYVTKLGKFDEGYAADFTVINELEKHTNSYDLAWKIENVMDQALQDNNAALKNVVGKLQNEQFKRWMSKGWSTKRVNHAIALASTLRGDPADGTFTRVYLAYFDFHRANTS